MSQALRIWSFELGPNFLPRFCGHLFGGLIFKTGMPAFFVKKSLADAIEFFTPRWLPLDPKPQKGVMEVGFQEHVIRNSLDYLVLHASTVDAMLSAIALIVAAVLLFNWQIDSLLRKANCGPA